MAQAKDESVTTPDEIVVEADEIVVEEASTSESPTATATLTDEKVASPLGGERVVYVASAEPPKARSNRLVGGLLALVGAVLYAAAYAGFAALVSQVLGTPGGFTAFIRDAAFWVPVLFFTIAFVLVTLLLNRATWWIHVLASLLVAGIVYLASAGVLVLLGTGSFVALLTTPYVIAAAVIAREISIWVGLLIARRGIRITARNRADRDAFDAEQAGKSDGAPASA